MKTTIRILMITSCGLSGHISYNIHGAPSTSQLEKATRKPRQETYCSLSSRTTKYLLIIINRFYRQNHNHMKCKHF